MSDPKIVPAPTDWYGPNQQAVRGDESGPAEAGDGGSPPVDGTGGINPDDPNPKTADQQVAASVAAAGEPPPPEPAPSR